MEYAIGEKQCLCPTAQEKSTASEDKLTEKTMSIDEEENAPKQEASEKEEERTEGSEEGDTNTSSLTIRIPKYHSKEKADEHRWSP